MPTTWINLGDYTFGGSPVLWTYQYVSWNFALQDPPLSGLLVGDKIYNVQFNDSVLSTAAWNNPRYAGSKSKTQVLNKYTAGDVTYGTKAAVQKYTRNIYVGDYIASCSGSDDPNLVPFPGFSYLMSSKYITVNDDNTIEENRFRAGVPDEKKGFYRSFLEDFTPGTKCQVYLLNEGVINSLEDSYDVYFADGRLKKIAHFNNINQENDVNGVLSPSGDKLFIWAEDIDEPFNSFNIINNSDKPETWNGPYGEVTEGGVVGGFFNATATSYQLSPDNRYFFTLTQGPEFPVVTASIGISLDVPILAQTGSGIIPGLSQISTAEYYTIRSSFGLRYVNLVDKYKFTKPYFDDGYGDFGGYLYGDTYYMGYYLSRLNTSIPSVLVNLPKDEHLPTGLTPGDYIGGTFHPDPGALQGPKFVIIPENIHPYIKDNIKYFLAKAGLINTNESITTNSRNRQLL